MNNVVRPEFDRMQRIATEIKAVLDEIHRELARLGQDGWPLEWRNGHSPWELELAALQEKHAISFDIVWNTDGRTAKSVRVTTRDE
jgi:hypothetical protein